MGIKIDTSESNKMSFGDSEKDTLEVNARKVFKAGMVEAVSAPVIAAGELVLDLALSTVFNVALTENVTTLTINNALTSQANSFTLILTADGTPRTIAWGGSVKFAGGIAPTLTGTNGKIDVITLMSVDAGTSWIAFVSGQDF